MSNASSPTRSRWSATPRGATRNSPRRCRPTQIKATYPLPAYNYRVTILQDGASLVLSFAEVSGLSMEYEPVTYKHGLSFVMGVKIIPGMRQQTKLTLKRGVSKGSDY